jgi:coenzyme F420 hydrogenase subunit beta
MRTILDEKQGIFIPEFVDPSHVSGEGLEFAVCPGKGLAINEISRQIYGFATHESFELGRYRLAAAACIVDPKIRENASSGGVMTGIAHYLLEKGLVEGVTASRFTYGGTGPRTEVFVARDLEDLISAQGSKYCPTGTNQLVRECVQRGGRYLFLGTPCQVGALRLAIQQEPNIEKFFPYTMANFCGGYRDFRNLDSILSVRGVDPTKVKYFRFRGGGQPGSMLARTIGGQTVSEAYPDYVRNWVIPTQTRCWYCLDATGELADFACGDAWIERLIQDRHPWSIILARSRFSEEIVNEMASAGLIKTRTVSPEEIIDSQRSNITSKKYRQHARIQVSRLLGITMPKWDVRLPRDKGNYRYEFRVLFGKTQMGLWLRKMKHLIRKLLKR